MVLPLSPFLVSLVLPLLLLQQASIVVKAQKVGDTIW
jgi:hypothetical protein